MPKISVIIPAYNRAYIITEAIDSVLNQTFRDFELLVIDDGSTDNTREVVKSIGDNRVKYFYKDNGGASSARNMGLGNSTGDFVAFLDSDDLWPGDYLEKILSHFERNGKAGVIYCLTIVKQTSGKVVDSDSPVRCYSGDVSAKLFVNSVVWPSGAVIRKDIIEGMYFDENLRNSEDSDIFLRLSLKTHFKFADNVKVFRGSSEDSLSNACGINCSKILVLERFYYLLAGKAIVPRNIAMKKLSHSCRRVAEKFRKNLCRKAALTLYKRAVGYYPLDIRLYAGILKAVMLNKNKDSMPDWKMPEPLEMI